MSNHGANQLVTVVVVGCLQDISQLILQMTSIQRYGNGARYIVVANEVAPLAAKEFSSRVAKVADQLRLPNLRIIRFQELLPCKCGIYHGWIVQQALKIYVSTIVETPFYVVLDTKNVIISSQWRDLLFDSQKKPLYRAGKRAKDYDKMRNSYLYWGIEVAPDTPTAVNTTPFVIDVNQARAMLSAANQDPENLIRLFFGLRACQEFDWYMAYVLSVAPDSISTCNAPDFPSVTIWGGGGLKTLERAFPQIATGNIAFFAVSRYYAYDPISFEKIAAVFYSRGLISQSVGLPELRRAILSEPLSWSRFPYR